MLDQKKIISEFPILSRKVDGKKLIYLDNAATSQKPIKVIDAISDYYRHSNANVHRGIHTLSEESTSIFESAKKIVADFFGAKETELILTRNATEAINGIVYGFAEHSLSEGDVIITTLMEHHANLVPWQELAKKKKLKLLLINVDENGRLDLSDLKAKCADPKVKILALTHVSNTLGTVNDIEKIVSLIKPYRDRIKLVIDGAQSAPHLKINFDQTDIDFYAFSGHKMLGPMGIGGILVKEELLKKEIMRPWLFGGGMIEAVFPQTAVFNQNLSDRFTAGTPDVASLVGLKAACECMTEIGMKQIEDHDREIVEKALSLLEKNKSLRIVGPTRSLIDKQKIDRLGSVAFIHHKVHAHDVAQVLASEGVATRSGHHCCMPLHTAFSWSATLRASFQIYTTFDDLLALSEALAKVEKIFA